MHRPMYLIIKKNIDTLSYLCIVGQILDLYSTKLHWTYWVYKTITCANRPSGKKTRFLDQAGKKILPKCPLYFLVLAKLEMIIERVHNARHKNTWPSILPSHENKNCFPGKVRTLLYCPYFKKSVKTKWRVCYVK